MFGNSNDDHSYLIALDVSVVTGDVVAGGSSKCDSLAPPAYTNKPPLIALYEGKGYSTLWFKGLYMTS